MSHDGCQVEAVAVVPVVVVPVPWSTVSIQSSRVRHTGPVVMMMVVVVVHGSRGPGSVFTPDVGSRTPWSPARRPHDVPRHKVLTR